MRHGYIIMMPIEDVLHSFPVCDSCNGGLYLKDAGKCRCPVNLAGDKCQFSGCLPSDLHVMNIQ